MYTVSMRIVILLFNCVSRCFPVIKKVRLKKKYPAEFRGITASHLSDPNAALCLHLINSLYYFENYGFEDGSIIVPRLISCMEFSHVSIYSYLAMVSIYSYLAMDKLATKN